MAASSLQGMEKALRFGWGDTERGEVERAGWAWLGQERLDPDWWEPRYDAPWRRQDARARAIYGGQHVAAPKPPNRGPNNPYRLRRELEWAESSLAEAQANKKAAIKAALDALDQIVTLKKRLRDVTE